MKLSSRFLFSFVVLLASFYVTHATHPPTGSMPDDLELARQKVAKAKEEILRAESLLNQQQTPSEVKGVFSRIGELFGRHEKHDVPTDVRELKEHAKETLVGEPASTTEQIKGKFRELLHFGQEKAGETAEDMKRKSEAAKGSVQGAADYVKHQAEELKEGVKAKIHGAQDAAYEAKQSLEGKLYEGKDYLKHKAEQATQAIKETVGLQEQPKGFFERAKDKVTNLFHPSAKPKGTIEETAEHMKEKLQDLVGFHGHDISALDELRKRYEESRDELLRKTQEMYDYMAQEMKEPSPSGFQRARNEVMARFNEWQSSWDRLKHNLGRRVARVMGTGENYLIQSARYENGLSMQYVNDNGQESLTISGENIDPKLDTLSVLNHFRQESNLPLASNLANVTVDVHQLHRPNVTIRSTRVEGDITYEYQFRDGKETLNVTFVSGKEPGALDDQRVLNSFRQHHGIIIPPEAQVFERHGHHPGHLKPEL